MKRYIKQIIAVLLIVPLFVVSVSAKNVVMDEVVPNELMPVGYVTPYFAFPSDYDSSYTYMWWYDPMHSLYLLVKFKGTCTIALLQGTNFSPYFSNPSSMTIRAYPCDGRDIFTFQPGDTMNITLPEGEAFKFRTIDADGEIHENLKFTYMFDLLTYSQVPKMIIDFAGSGIWTNNSSGGQINFSNLAASISKYLIENSGYISGMTYDNGRRQILYSSGMTIPVKISDKTARSYDYYNLPKSGGITTTMDYELSWDHSGMFRIGGVPVYGYPVAVNNLEWNVYNVVYDTGSYYQTVSARQYVKLFDQDLLTGTTNTRMPVSVLNKYLTHFGYEPVYYSDTNAGISNDLNNISDQMAGWSSGMSGFESSAKNAVNVIDGSVKSFSSIFSGVWYILPNWFLSILAVYLVFLVGRKILGR